MQTQTELFVGADVVEEAPPVRLETGGEVWSLVVDPSQSWDAVRAQIAEELEPRADELHGRNLRLNLGGRRLDLLEVRRISTLLRDGFKAAIIAIECSPDAVHRYAETAFKMPLIAPALDTRPRMPLVFTGAPLVELGDEFVEPVEDDSVPTDLPELTAGATPSDSVDVVIEDDDPEITEQLAAETDSESVDRLAEDLIGELMDGTELVGEAEQSVEPVVGNVLLATSDVDDGLLEVETTDIIDLGMPVPSEAGRRVMVLEKTLRSGKTIRFAGDVMVYGDVNSGAHIEADGNIVVFGSLRGLAHAGARGDARAVIISFDLGAPQLRIADHIGFASGGSQLVIEEPQGIAKISGDVVGSLSSFLGRSRQPARVFNPEIAWVEGGEIRIASYEGRLPA